MKCRESFLAVLVCSAVDLLVLAMPLHAQESIFRDYSTDDGLPDSRVSPILQDSKGYMWFGTQAGLTRYDGDNFVTFTSAKEIPGIFGRAIIEDHTGAIWFAYTGFSRGGVLRFSNGRITDFQGSSAALPHEAASLAEDRDGVIWVGSASGLTRIRFTDSSRTDWKAEPLPGLTAQALYADTAGTMWIGTADGKILAYRNGEIQRIADNMIPNVRPEAIYHSRNGSMWFGGIFGVLEIRGEEQHRYTQGNGLPARGVWSFCEDHSGNFWICTAEGLYRKEERGGKVVFAKESTFGNAVVYDACLDAEGNVWFASDPGIRKMVAPDLLLDFPHRDALATSGFGPIAQQADGAMVFGSRNEGVFRLHGGRLEHGPSVRPYTTLTILSIYPDNEGRVWYGIKEGGLIMENTRYQTGTSRGLNGRSVHSFCETDEGDVLIGTSEGLWITGERGEPVSLSAPSIDSLTVFDIVRFGEPGQYWIGTDKGTRIVSIKDRAVAGVREVEFSPLQTKIVYTLHTDGRTLWCGTDGGGIVSFDGSSFHQYTSDDGLVGDRVYALAEDSLHMLWVGTSSGLSQFDGSSFRSFAHREGFGEIGLHGLCVDRNGMLWVSNLPGISKIKPQLFPKSSRPPPVYILDVQVDTTHISREQVTELDAGPAVITFRYAGLSFSDERNVRYRHRLHGFDRDWSSPVTAREVRYTHLPGGSYVFEVISRSADGVWSSQPAAVSFSILPPLWARWWFLTAVLLSLTAGVYLLYRYRLAKAVELERTRSRIAMDLHDDIGSSLTRISVLSEVAQRQSGEDEGSRRAVTLARIGETARESIDTLGDIVWSVDPRHDDLQNVVRRIAQFGQEVCTGKGIAFETDLQSTFDQTKLSLDQRRDVYLLFKEALTNVVRHANASNVRFTVREEHGKALLSLIDNGVGMASQDPAGGHGLSSMKERALRVGGTLIVGGSIGEGTTTSLQLKTA